VKKISSILFLGLCIINWFFCDSKVAVDGKNYWFSDIILSENGIVICGEIDIEKSNFKVNVNGFSEIPTQAFIWRNSDGNPIYRIRLEKGNKDLRFFNGKIFTVLTDGIIAVDTKGMIVSGWITTKKEPFNQESIGPELGVLSDASETNGIVFVSTIPTNFTGSNGIFYNVYYFWNGLDTGKSVWDGLIIADKTTLIQGKKLPPNTGIYFQIDQNNIVHIPFIGNVDNLKKKYPSKQTIVLKTITGEEYPFFLAEKIILDDISQLVTDGYILNTNINIDGIITKVKIAHYQVLENKQAVFSEIEK